MVIRMGDTERRRLADLKREERAIKRPFKEAARKASKASGREREKRVGATAPGQRKQRETNPGFLAYLRRQPCEAADLGGCGGPIEAAHVRYSDAAHGSVNPGMQRKNHDRHANPLCHDHHQHDQHKRAERAFWSLLGKDAYETAAKHFRAYQGGGDEASS